MFSDKVKQYFTDIIDVPSPSGYESRCQKIFQTYALQFVDEVYEDNFGNIVSYIQIDQNNNEQEILTKNYLLNNGNNHQDIVTETFIIMMS